MSDDPADPKSPDGIKVPRILREKETFSYVVPALTDEQRAGKVWLFGGQRNVIPGLDDEEDADELPQERTIELGGGGTVTIRISANLFNLTPADRAFVFDLVDKMMAYEGPG